MRASVRSIMRFEDEVADAIRRHCPARLAFEQTIAPEGAAAALAGVAVRTEYLVIDTRGSDPLEEVQRLVRSAEGTADTIVVGDRDGAELYRSLALMGVSEYAVAGRENVGQVVGAALERLEEARQARGQAAPPGAICAVLGMNGGDGASLVAAALARRAAKDLGRTLLAEINLAGSQHLAFDRPPSHGWAAVAREPDRLDALMLDRLVSGATERLALLSAAETFDDPCAYADDTVPRLAARAHASGFRRIVLDGRRDGPGRMAALLAGTAVLVARPTLAGLEAMLKVIPALQERGERRIVAVLNRVGEVPAAEIAPAEFASRIERPVLSVPFDRAVPKAAFAGDSLPLTSRAALALGAVEAQAFEIETPSPGVFRLLAWARGA